MNILLTPETVKIASDILIQGQMKDFNGNSVPPFGKCFADSETVIAKHILWKNFVDKTGCQIPKIFGYLVMDKLFGNCTGKDKDGFAGYHKTLIL